MGKLSNPSRNVSQFVYDFSRYNYSNDKDETAAIERVKKITQNDRSDDGIKEIQLELLWNELTKQKQQKPKSLSSQSQKSSDTLKTKSELKKERKARRKKEAALKKQRREVKKLETTVSHSPRTVLRKTSSAQKSTSSWSNAPSWSEVKKRSAQDLDPALKMNPIDKLPSGSLSRPELKQDGDQLQDNDSILLKLQEELGIYGLECAWTWTDGSRRLVLRQIGTAFPCETVQGQNEKEKFEFLKRAYRLFTFKSNYTGEREQRVSLEKLVNFMWSTQTLRYSVGKKVKLPKSIKKKNFAFTTTPSLLQKQLSWQRLSAIEKANLIVMIRSRLGFAKTKESIESALVQPGIYTQLLDERPQLAPSLLRSDNHKEADKAAIMVENVGLSEGTQSSDVQGTSDDGDVTKVEAVGSLPNGHNVLETLSPVELKDKEDTKASNSSKDENAVKAKPSMKVEESVQKTFRWPSTVANEADGILPESQWPQMGMLKAVGYAVGASGLNTSSRLKLLRSIYCEKLPYVDSKVYVAEWGRPETATRLKKMAETLAALARNAKRKNANMKLAIKDWEHDLAWLKDEYYLKHKYTWVWPTSVNQGEKLPAKEIKPEPVKIYDSSREFLTEQYTNKAGELCCQVCQSALPFKLANGEYYWEEVSISKQIESSPFSDLVLCPNHRAMYVNANESEIHLIEQVAKGKSKEISLMLAGKSEKLFITHEHLKRVLPASINIQSNISPYSSVRKSLINIRNLYLYESNGYWHLTSKNRASLVSTTSKSEAIEWLKGFDSYRNFSQPSNIKEQEPPVKKVKVKPSLKNPTAMRFGVTKKVTQTSSYKTGYTLCTVCGGDGGVNGGCWKCGGSGWM
ncbi:hypothetical protein LNL84_01695 [Vibrio sp. ZSDZ34]|uniref:Uncharacterized protein n=1 Tax=Vibrio gelatinilyticus TaxID=2893468 RepID=A0A9X1W7R4_9VIBR|nr:hypothetical protein [Vibrio gelatinilyticus]MCJ2375543.1 hypothetical protein [Vibrio gelatinilyticus]